MGVATITATEHDPHFLEGGVTVLRYVRWHRGQGHDHGRMSRTLFRRLRTRWSLWAQVIVAYDVGGLRDALNESAPTRSVNAGDRSGLLQEVVGVLRALTQRQPAQLPEPWASVLTWADMAELSLMRYRTFRDPGRR
jgi:hypothetical protein